MEAQKSTQRDIKELTHLMVVDSDIEARHALWFVYRWDKLDKRKELEDALMTYLEHENIVIVGNVAFTLGSMKRKRAVPELITVLQSKRILRKCWHSSDGELEKWGEHNARERIVTALGEIGDHRAVAVLQTYLNSNKHGVYGGNAAYALYKIDGKRYSFMDFSGKEKLFEPSPELIRQQNSSATAE